jgi:hypothetical protein
MIVLVKVRDCDLLACSDAHSEAPPQVKAASDQAG